MAVQEYVATGELLGKAGAYALQGKGKVLIESVKGSWTNVYGLPVEELIEMVHMLGYQ